MLPVGPQEYLLLVLFKILMFNFQLNTVKSCTDTVITACNDKTTCIQTYEEVYKLLGSHKNYFNIAQALYPAKWLPSLRVSVALHGANGTENCRPVKYTWSMSCMFATFPKNVLEILSLGAILVTPRTQDLNITINPFCCNICQEDRITMIETVLAALQDLAVSPGIQDPRLNTAECVSKGDGPNLADTGRSREIKAIVWLSFCFTFFLGPSFAIYALLYFNNVESDDKAMHSALTWVSCLMLIVEIGLFLTAVVLTAMSTAHLKCHILPVLLLILLVGPLVGTVLFRKEKPDLKSLTRKLQIVIFPLAYLSLYHFCWIVIGIMMNPLWSVTVVLFLGVILAVLVFSLYNFFLHFENEIGTFLLVLTIICIPVLCLVAIITVAGQTVFGRNTTDEIVRTVFLSFSIAFMKRVLSTMNTEDKNKKCKKNKKNNQNGKKEGGTGENGNPLEPLGVDEEASPKTCCCCCCSCCGC